jgi:hypothetical protein
MGHRNCLKMRTLLAVAHAYYPCYLGGEIRGIKVQSQSSQIV